MFNKDEPIVAPDPGPKRYQIALFVGKDAKSEQLIEWFTKDPSLSKLKDECEFQVYTEDNKLYRTRFESIVPASQFPVVLFQDSTGGHIHAAGHAMLPSTPEELFDDLQHGYELHEQTRQAQRTGALKARGYSWDSAISPTLQLAPEDCPDGYCPVEPNEPTWRPFDRDRDRNRDRLFVNEIAGRLWNLHEFGGIAKKRRKLKRHRFRVGQHGPIRVIGPGKFARIELRTAAQANRARRLIEEENQRRGAEKPRRYPKRPFMKPALETHRAQLPKFWRDSVK